MTAETNSNTPSKPRRRGDRGIILITTLLLLTLLSAFAIGAQNRALSQARVLNKVIEIEEERIALQSARALSLPLVGEIMLDDLDEGEVNVDYQGEVFVASVKAVARRGWYALTVR